MMAVSKGGAWLCRWLTPPPYTHKEEPLINPATTIRCAAQLLLGTLLALASVALAAEDAAYDPAALLQELESYPYAVSVSSKAESVRNHEIGLGPMQKSDGDWIFRSSERLDGELRRETWQIIDGFAAREVLAGLEELLLDAGARELYSCNARACGSAAQWASRVFKQRILYGRAEEQRYRVYVLSSAAGEFRVVLYSGARTTDRQYLHVDLLALSSEE